MTMAPESADLTSAGHCPLCGAAARSLAFPYEGRWEEHRYRHLACSWCKATYLDPMPTPDELAAIYTWGNYHEEVYADVNVARYQRAVQVLARTHDPNTTRLLDFGCGTAGFLLAARQAGYEGRGVEYDAEVADRASARAGVPVARLDETVASGCRFDVIVLRDVLPHLPDPAAALRRLEELLDDRGVFFFDGPLENGLSLVRLATGSLKSLRRRTGLDEVRMTTPTMLFRVGAAAQRRFLVDRMGYGEHLFEVYETGWPYHVPGRRPASVGIALKESVGLAAIGTAKLANRAGLGLGNRFYGLYEPGR